MSWKGIKLPWAADIDDDHYKAAFDFLSLKWEPDFADDVVDQLRNAELVHHHPSDLLRAANLEPRPLADTGVLQEVRKAIKEGQLIPPLCVNLPDGIVIADGYHRLSAALALAPFHNVPLKLAGASDPITPPGR